MAKGVLIVDDSPTIRSLIRSFLTNQPGIVVCGEAVDGVDAIEKAKMLSPDLVLLDLAMPRMNGVEAAFVLRGAMPNLRLILFTMYSENMSKALTSASGVDMVLSKPDGMRNLVSSVRKLLDS